ncbi:hypothetical protein BT93_J1288 [Corymbia citriodora subsp. variegata]|nr:hypothetical protein BT93_J1288 [Corymbia citriodora subsp. variegata]
MMSLSSPSPPAAPATASPSRSRSHLVDTIFSYDGNVMLAAIICLLLVILFVLLLHFYARCFLSYSSSSRHHRRRLRPPPSSAALSARLQMLTRDAALLSPSPPRPASKGLDPSTISSIPLFVARPDGGEKDEECVVCLGGFEENDVGRRLPECGHGFHVDCIDTWLRSRASCPICRESVVANTRKETESKNKLAVAEDADSADSADESRDATVQEEMGSSSAEIAIDIVPDGADDDGDGDAGSPSSPSARTQQQPTTTLGGSLKRMLSRNRAESKIHPSSASSPPPPSSVNISDPESNASC